MKTSINENRKNNLLFLKGKFGSQSCLAAQLIIPSLSQATISDVERKKRDLKYTEARKIEGVMVIPHGWMDKKDWIRSGWGLIQHYRGLNESGRKLFNQTISFVEERIK